MASKGVKPPIVGGAVFGPLGKDDLYRYQLWRDLPPPAGMPPPRLIGRAVMFCMTNPSTATAETNDPTVAKCMRFAIAWGFDRLYVGNAFAFRSTDPKKLEQVVDPIGPSNDHHLVEMAKRCEFIVCAWGQPGNISRRGEYLRKVLLKDFDLRYLKLAKDGQPYHPLYLLETLKPAKWELGGKVAIG